MDQELQEKIAEYYSKLPPSVQVKFSSMQWLETLKQISAKYELSEEQIQTLGTETTLVLLGIIHLGEYENILESELKLQKESTEKLVIEINDLILKDISPQLIETFNVNNQPLTELPTAESQIEEKLDEKFKKLPPEVQNAINKSNYKTVLYNIAQNQKLDVYQMGILEKAVTNVMLGTILPDKFSENLKESLKLSDEKNTALVKEINDKIFKTIRGEMMENKKEPEIEKIKNDNDSDILKQAGIEIVPTELEAPKAEPTPQPVAAKVPIPSAPASSPIPSVTPPATPASSAKPTKDPYRMPIE